MFSVEVPFRNRYLSPTDLGKDKASVPGAKDVVQ
jgi:hypothetical protein